MSVHIHVHDILSPTHGMDFYIGIGREFAQKKRSLTDLNAEMKRLGHLPTSVATQWAVGAYKGEKRGDYRDADEVNATVATYERNVKSGKWVPLNGPRRTDQWRIIVKVPEATRGVYNGANRTMYVNIIMTPAEIAEAKRKEEEAALERIRLTRERQARGSHDAIGTNPTGYARRMSEAAGREKEKAIKQLAIYTVTFGSRDPLTKNQEKEVERHRTNEREWKSYSTMNAQALLKIIRENKLPNSMFGYGVTDAKFTGTYSAQIGKERKSVSGTVNAPDHYAASDILKEKFIKQYGSNYFNPIVKWSSGTNKLPAGSQSLKIAKRAGPEEDAARDASSTEQKLERAMISLRNHVARGATVNNYKSYGVVDRFNDLRDQAIQEGIWEAFCRKHGIAPSATAHDWFA